MILMGTMSPSVHSMWPDPSVEPTVPASCACPKSVNTSKSNRTLTPGPARAQKIALPSGTGRLVRDVNSIRRL
jgi:hypothetical protein